MTEIYEFIETATSAVPFKAKGTCVEVEITSNVTALTIEYSATGKGNWKTAEYDLDTTSDPIIKLPKGAWLKLTFTGETTLSVLMTN